MGSSASGYCMVVPVIRPVSSRRAKPPGRRGRRARGASCWTAGPSEAVASCAPVPPSALSQPSPPCPVTPVCAGGRMGGKSQWVLRCAGPRDGQRLGAMLDWAWDDEVGSFVSPVAVRRREQEVALLVKKKVDFTWSVCYAHTLLAAAMPHQGEKTVQGFILVL